MTSERSYVISVDHAKSEQKGTEQSFIGGYPRLPSHEVIPSCVFCNKTQSFFLQVGFPDGHAWKGKSLAIFACTSCFQENSVIPDMVMPIKRAKISKSFLEAYQRNFRFIVFDTIQGNLRRDYMPRVLFRRLDLVEDNISIDENKIGGRPTWLLEDESPGSYGDNGEMIFLMQLLQLSRLIRFDIGPGAPRQVNVDYFSNSIVNSDKPYYSLFIGNNIYFFGTSPDTEQAMVYALTQV